MKKLNIHNLKAKEIKKLHTWLRTLIQILYFLFLPSVYTAAFAGVKYIFTQIGAGEAIGMTSFVTVLIVLCAYTILFGRFFCGFACAFGSLGDGIHAFYLWCFKKRKKKPVLLSEKITEKLSYLKYLVLTVIAVLCFAGVYGKARGTSPWDVFSMLHAGNFHLQGYLPGVILLIFIIVGMCLEERFFLSESVSDGSCILIASGASVLCIAPRQRKLHQRLQWMYEEMPIRDRTSRRRLDQSRGRLFPMSKMY